MIKRFTLQVTARILFIIVCCVLLSFFILQSYWFSSMGILTFIIIQGIFLTQYVNSTNYSLVKFVEALKNEDHSVYFSPSKKGDSFAKVYEDFNFIIKMFKQNKIEKEAQYTYFKYILEHVNLGIISIKKEDLYTDKSTNEILFLNKAACHILKQPKHSYWHRLAAGIPWLIDDLKRISDGGKVLVDFGDDSEQKQLSVEVVEIELINAPYLIISFQDIRSEIEQKEIEAWHNVIRVLAHEMLNSFTPVSSLASTIKSITEDQQGNLLAISKFNEEDIQDINLAAKTISKRSEGLLEFVKDYRTISSIPVPNKQLITVKKFLGSVEVLMKQSLADANVHLHIDPIPNNLQIYADGKLIEQVLINLINNSMHALQGVPAPSITISCSIKEHSTLLMVSDNGKGIEEEIINQIFIPFYTTKKNGSGIGLSLSKNILKKHGGNLMVQSVPGKTSFTLLFKS